MRIADNRRKYLMENEEVDNQDCQESEYVSTNIGGAPVEDYREIVAIQNGVH